MKTTLCMISLTAGCAQAIECADSHKNLTVTDGNGRVLMTNAAYTCAYRGRLFFARGCVVEGFAATNINAGILSRLGLDLKDVQAKGRADVQKKQESDRAYQRYVQNLVSWKAIEDQRAARRAEAEAAQRAEIEQVAHEAAREEMSNLIAMNPAPAVQWSEPPQIWQSSGAVLYPGFDQWWNHSSHRHWHHPGDVREKDASQSVVTHPGKVAANNGPTLPALAPRANRQGNPGGNQAPSNVFKKSASPPSVIHRGILAAPNHRNPLPVPMPRANFQGNASGSRKVFSRPAPSVRR